MFRKASRQLVRQLQGKQRAEIWIRCRQPSLTLCSYETVATTRAASKTGHMTNDIAHQKEEINPTATGSKVIS